MSQLHKKILLTLKVTEKIISCTLTKVVFKSLLHSVGTWRKEIVRKERVKKMEKEINIE